MPHFIVNGADRESGDPMRVTVEAADADQAEGRAVGLGLFISSIELTTDPGLAGALTEEPGFYVSPARVPGYAWLRYLGHGFVFGGLAAMVLTMVGVVVTVVLAARHEGGITAPTAFAALAILAGGVLTGGAWMACGQLIFAFRDMARNTWQVHEIRDRLARVERTLAGGS